MCGIAGIFKLGNKHGVEKMLESLVHRGPDDQGVYSDTEKDVYLGHRRLSIIDLSSAGHQPMSNETKNIWLVFNGEIYNYRKLRSILINKGHYFKSNTDSETIIHGYEEFGTKIFEKADGMWAATIYDEVAGKLILSRDPAGIKPLYYVRHDGGLIFSSEIKAIKKNLQSKLTLNNNALVKFLAQGYIYGNDTIYNEIKEVPPATTLIFDTRKKSIEFENNYRLPSEQKNFSLKDGVERFKILFDKSVEKSLQSDVPVGIFLSGGIDSSLIGHYVRKKRADLKAFTIGFEEKSFDESQLAKRIGSSLGFNKHYVHILKPQDVIEDIYKILDSFGEPFGDMSALPTFYVSKLAKDNGCPVILSGDGGDELFGGYPTHYLPSVLPFYLGMPNIARSFLSKLVDMLPHSYRKLGTDEIIRRFIKGASNDYRKAHFLWRVVFDNEKIKHLVKKDFYEQYVADIFEKGFSDFFDEKYIIDKKTEVMKVDFRTFLASNCLVKSDICSMNHSIELRVPFLNRPIIDFSATVPTKYKVRPLKTKIILRKVAEEILPPQIRKLKKQGFLPPISHWLKDELRPYMMDTLSKENIQKTGFLNYDTITHLINGHLNSKSDNSRQIWSLISLVRFLNVNKI